MMAWSQVWFWFIFIYPRSPWWLWLYSWIAVTRCNDDRFENNTEFLVHSVFMPFLFVWIWTGNHNDWIRRLNFYEMENDGMTNNEECMKCPISSHSIHATQGLYPRTLCDDECIPFFSEQLLRFSFYIEMEGVHQRIKECFFVSGLCVFCGLIALLDIDCDGPYCFDLHFDWLLIP